MYPAPTINMGNVVTNETIIFAFQIDLVPPFDTSTTLHSQSKELILLSTLKFCPQTLFGSTRKRNKFYCL